MRPLNGKKKTMELFTEENLKLRFFAYKAETKISPTTYTIRLRII